MIKKLSDTTTRIRAFYNRHDKYVPVISFFAGFTWDSLTLKRIDLIWDDIILFLYILLAGIFILIINLIREKKIDKPLFLKYQEWYPNIVQFFFGGLFSGYVVYYFKSTAITKNGLFLLFLVVLLVGNEFVKDRLGNFKFQFIFYYLATFSFFIFYLPVILKAMGVWVFLLSGLVSSVFTGGFIYILYRLAPEIDKKHFIKLGYILTGIYVVFNILYFTNIIPPVPLSLKDSGVYHSVTRTDEEYLCRFEKGPWYQFYKKSDNTYHYAPGDTVFCFVSVFAPTELKTRIYHHWQYYDKNKEKWITTDRTNYRIVGGRDGGYRGFTSKKNVRPGSWRIDVETDREQVLGELNFDIAALDSSRTLEFKEGVF